MLVQFQDAGQLQCHRSEVIQAMQDDGCNVKVATGLRQRGATLCPIDNAIVDSQPDNVAGAGVQAERDTEAVQDERVRGVINVDGHVDDAFEDAKDEPTQRGQKGYEQL